MKTRFKILFFLQIIIMNASLFPNVVGSDSSVSRQSRAFFRKATSLLNKMNGFSVFQKGFVLEGPGTEVSFDAFFPIYGDVVLNGGTLTLKGDLSFRNPFQIGVGTIIGNSFSLEFPRNIQYLDFPSLYYLKLIANLVDRIEVGYDVYSIDWGYDDAYIATGLRGKGGNSELKILSFNGTSLALVTSEDFGNSALNSVRWSPTSDYLVTGASGGTELKSWLFTRGVDTLAEVDSKNIGATNAVAWRPDGAYIAVGHRSDSLLRVYPIASGIFGTVITSSLGSNVTVRNNALDWQSTGDYLAVGLQRTNSQTELKIFSFNGSTLTAAGTKEINTNVNGVAWRPNSTILAVGLSTHSEALRLYSYDASGGTLTEITSARVDLRTTVYGLAWNADGTYLAVAKAYAAQGYELEVYYFDSSDNTLHLVTGYNSDKLSRAVGWAHAGDYVVNGDDSEHCAAYNFVDKPFVFNNLKIYFSSEVRAHASIHFQGDCVINGSGNILELNSTTSLVVEPGATLCLEDMTIKGISGGNIQCQSDTSAIHMRDVHWVQDGSFTFTLGSIHFSNDIELSGNSIFAYQSLQTSTLAAKSTLTMSPLFTFSYDPLDGTSNALLLFEDSTSLLALDGVTIHTSNAGLHLKKGTMKILRDSFFETDDTNGITLGNNKTSEDFTCDILSGSVLQLSKGALNYKNMQPTSWNMISERSWLQMKSGTFLRLYHNMDLGLGMLQTSGEVILSRVFGKDVKGTVITMGRMVKEYLAGNL